MFYGKANDHQEDDASQSLLHEDGAGIGKSVCELKVYRLAYDLGVAARRLSLQLPKYELYETGSQLCRVAKSVSANFVEGYVRRRYKAEHLRFLIFAKASLSETGEHLRYVKDCHPDHQARADALLMDANTLGCKLHRFMRQVEAHHRVWSTSRLDQPGLFRCCHPERASGEPMDLPPWRSPRG